MPNYSESLVETPYAVHCPIHGVVYLTEEEYLRQLDQPDLVWSCPRMSTSIHAIGLCGEPSDFQDGIYETENIEHEIERLTTELNHAQSEAYQIEEEIASLQGQIDSLECIINSLGDY